jgi:CheY-like chemotaxis protein
MAEELGFTTIEATSGKEAVDIFRRRHRDLALVLLDVSPPMTDGRAALWEIHKINSRIPVVLGSPFEAKEADLPAEVQAGSLRKPYRQAEFRGILQRTLA